jgi:glutathione S-transferase
MKLLMTPTSPFARKVRIVLRETGLDARVEEIDLSDAGLSPVSPVEAVAAANPLGKIPALLRDEGALFDSRVIAEYLDALAPAGSRVLPPAGPDRWAALRRQALADGIADAAVLLRYERVLRPAEVRWPAWMDGQLAKVRAAVAAAEAEGPPARFDLGGIALAASLAYLDLRFCEDDLWRGSSPRLLAWFDEIATRPSMTSTSPT